jgi:hypothetical protein
MLRRFDFTDQLCLIKAGNNSDPCMAELVVPLASLEVLGPPSGESQESRGWALVAECGLEFGIEEWQGVVILYAGTRDELEHALLHLPFSTRIAGAGGADFEGGWEVRRVDDAGTSFSMGRYPREASARCVAKIYEDRAHKQTYFVDQLGPPPLPRAGDWSVMRMDDNGQVFPVREHLSRGNALMHMRMLEEEPRHKQTYWVRKKD